MELDEAAATLDELREAGNGFRARFVLLRHGVERRCTWSSGEHFEIAGEFDGAPWVGYDVLSTLDAFVESVEATSRPDPVPEGHEVWRFVHGSLAGADGALDETVRSCLEAVLDDTFNAPSLYDGRDLRLGRS